MRGRLHREVEIWKRLVSLPTDLAEVFLEDLDSAVENRLKVLEAEAQQRKELNCGSKSAL